MADKSSVIIGIDQSLNRSGVVVITNDNTVLFKGVITPPKLTKTDRNKTERVSFIRDEIKSLVNNYRPDYVGMEDYSFGTRGQAFYMGELGGMLKLIASDLKWKMLVIPPTMVKKYATGKGNADKSLMLKEVYKTWNKDFDDDNICDAFVIAALTNAIMNVKNKRKSKSDFNANQWKTIQMCIKRKVDIY